jgi:hypothetical protein
MDEHVAHRLRMSSMGRSEVTTRWQAISISTPAGSTVSDVGCHLTAIIADVDGGTACGQHDIH